MSSVNDALVRAQQVHFVNQVMENERIARSVGIGLTEAQVLHLLVLRPECRTAKALTAATGLPTSTMADIIERLVRAGFVTRERDTTDRRVVNLRTTERVARLADAYRDSDMASRLAQLLPEFADHELSVVLRYFERLNDTAAGSPTTTGAPPSR